MKRGVSLTVFEIDRGFSRVLNEFFSAYKNERKFAVIEGDVLKTWKNCASQNEIPERFFGNLPYNVAATIIADTINSGIRFDKCVFTVQKEVAQRMSAKPGTEDYSSFSVLCQWAYNVKNIADLAGGNFWPKPNVMSRAVLFTKKDAFPGCQNPELFMKMLRCVFALRRKTIKNNLSKMFPAAVFEKALETCGISPQERAENLPLERLLLLSDALNSIIL